MKSMKTTQDTMIATNVGVASADASLIYEGPTETTNINNYINCACEIITI